MANEAHLGGIAFTFAAAPLVMRIEVKKASKLASFDASALESLATTPELREVLDELEAADVPEVRRAWLDEFAANAIRPGVAVPAPSRALPEVRSRVETAARGVVARIDRRDDLGRLAYRFRRTYRLTRFRGLVTPAADNRLRVRMDRMFTESRLINEIVWKGRERE